MVEATVKGKNLVFEVANVLFKSSTLEKEKIFLVRMISLGGVSVLYESIVSLKNH